MKAAFYDFTHWVTSKDGILDMMPVLSMPLTFELAPYEDADIIFIDFGGNADHIPFFGEMLDKFPQKKFVIWAGENLRRYQPLIPKKISTKASHKDWAQKLFPYLYLPSHVLFPKPGIKEDLYLYKLLLKHKGNPNVLSLLCEKAEILESSTCFFPLFMRKIMTTYVPYDILSFKAFSEERVLTHIKKIMLSLKPQIYKDGVLNKDKNIFCSIVFTNTIKERVIACKKISKVGEMKIYGRNPYDRGKTPVDRCEVYRQSRYAICFENSTERGYSTEKLFDVTYGGAIPIYWGDPEIELYCNKNAMILCKSMKDIKNLDVLVKETDLKLKEISTMHYYSHEHIETIFKIYLHARKKVLDFVNN